MSEADTNRHKPSLTADFVDEVFAVPYNAVRAGQKVEPGSPGADPLRGWWQRLEEDAR